MDVRGIIALFGIEDVVSVRNLKSGHINRTFLAECTSGEKYVLQSLNGDVFANPEAVMSNIGKITSVIAKNNGCDVKVPEYILTADGKNYAESGGEIYRLYRYTEPCQCSESNGYVTGYSYGCFMRMINAKGVRLKNTIEHFHSFSSYFSTLTAADSVSGLKKIDGVVMRRLSSLSEMLSQVFTVDFPKRNVHNDAKKDNIIIGTPCTVIDLDTAMSGYAAVDYGDIIRSSCTGENVDFSVIRDITYGFADGLNGILTDDEIDSLYYGILYVTGELAVRYLIDYLSEKKYFIGKTTAECLRRANTLLGQLSIFINCSEEITSIIYKAFKKQ